MDAETTLLAFGMVIAVDAGLVSEDQANKVLRDAGAPEPVTVQASRTVCLSSMRETLTNNGYAVNEASDA